MKNFADKDNDDQPVANGSDVDRDNGNAEAIVVGSSNEVECCSQELADDKPDDTDVFDESRPIKKAKSSNDEAFGSGEIINGMPIFGLVRLV